MRKLGLRWRLPGLGALAALAAPLVGIFSHAPPGVRLDGDGVYIDLARALEERGMREVLNHVSELRVEMREGALLIRFVARVA